MRLLYLLLFYFGALQRGFPQSAPVKFLIDTAIVIMKNNAVGAKSVAWLEIKQTAYKMAAAINTPYQLGPVMRYLYKSINDYHGAFFYRDSMFRWERGGERINDAIMQQWKKRAGILTKLLSHNIGYLRVPSMPGGSKAEFDKYAQNLNDSLCNLLERGINGIVVDLRIDGGGAMFPMILGLEQLLGDGYLGSFDIKNKKSWYIKENNFIIDSALATIAPKCAIHAQSMPVALLMGQGTGSSGEFLLIAFKGRKRTAFIGTKSAGYVTVNNGFPINDTAFMNLSVGYGADRLGRRYKKPIEPDVYLEGPDQFDNIGNDEKVKRAEKWVRQMLVK